jgi:RNA polymerase sigma-70 factor (ECF subfamily)
VAVDQQELVRRAARGDHDAFGVLVRGSVARLEAVARLILRDRELARDAVQDAYLRAWRDLPGLRDPDRFDAWLRRLVINACLDAERRRKRRPIEVAIRPIEPVDAGDIGLAIVNRDLLERAFISLGAHQRAVIVLHFYADLPMPAVAEALGIPLGTAQSRLGRALTAMRSAVARDEAVASLRAGGGQLA